MKRRTAREKAFQVLFQMDINDIDPIEAIEHVLESAESDPFLTQLVNGVNHHRKEIDKKISEHLEKWSMERLAAVEKALLRIATYEMFYEAQTPEGVAINEAVELANTYGDEKSGRFINGVLSKMVK